MKLLKTFLASLALATMLVLVPVKQASADLGSGIVLTLLNAGAATGSQFTWPGGIGFMDVSGTFNGATVTLQYVGSDGSSLHGAGASCVINSSSTYPNCIFYLPRALIQATITSAGGSTALTVKVYN